MHNILLQHHRALGDVLVMSALVRDIQLSHPNQFNIAVDTSVNDIWRYNPHIIDTATEDFKSIRLCYGTALELAGSRRKHFLCGFYEDFERQTGIEIPLLYPRPDYHLSEEEKSVPLVSGRYWIVVSGGKTDFITKHWIYKRWQQLVNILTNTGLNFVQVGGIGGNDKLIHFHPRLENTLCLVGLTTVRDIARLIYHAEGVICPITAVMHFAAALQKPCVVIGGGREEWWWNAYMPGLGNFGTAIKEDVKVPHKFLHTIGKLDCCSRRGCWKDTLTVGTNICKYPFSCGTQIVPKCMDMITISHVIEAVMAYYETGILPPIGTPKPLTIKNGKLCILNDNEKLPDNIHSSLAAALTLPEPKLLINTDGLTLLNTTQ